MIMPPSKKIDIEQENPIKIARVFFSGDYHHTVVTYEDCPTLVQSQSLAHGSAAAIEGGLC